MECFVKSKMRLVDVLGMVVRRPDKILRRAQILWKNQDFRNSRLRWLSALSDTSQKDIEDLIREIEVDRAFIRQVRNAYRRNTFYFPLPTDFMVQGGDGNTIFFHAVSLYVLVRLVRPRIVVETGGTPGKSSAFILQAMHRNKLGELYTIDLPPERTSQPNLTVVEAHLNLGPGLQANWCVPESLRDRQHLLLGPAQDLLPSLLSKLHGVDIYIDDSDHSYQHMLWELRTAYPFMRKGGYLWADDMLTNGAWPYFCDEARVIPQNFTSQGVIRKPIAEVD